MSTFLFAVAIVTVAVLLRGLWLFTITVSTKLTDSGSGAVLSLSSGYSYPVEVKVDDAVPNGSTSLAVAVAWTNAKAKVIYLSSDQNVTVVTNNSAGGAGTDTISLVAGVPLLWRVDGYLANPFTHDVTTTFWTNSSGNVANIDILVLSSL